MYPRYTNSDLSILLHDYSIRFNYRIKGRKNIIEVPDLQAVKQFFDNHGVLNDCINEKNIKKTGDYIGLFSDYFYNILEKTGAKIGLVVCWYTYLQMAFINACRKKGIPCIDIQHGFAGGNNHEAYVKWINIPVNGYNTMPTNFCVGLMKIGIV